MTNPSEGTPTSRLDQLNALTKKWANPALVDQPITIETQAEVLFLLGALMMSEHMRKQGFLRSADEAIELLNGIHAADPTVLQALIAHRVPCNEALVKHPTVQVGPSASGGWEVGLLGILNGLFGICPDGYGRIAAILKDGKLMGFGVWVPPPPLDLKGLTQESEGS